MVDFPSQDLSMLEEITRGLKRKEKANAKRISLLTDSFFTGQKVLDCLEQNLSQFPQTKLLSLANWLIELHLISPVSEAEKFLNVTSYYFFKVSHISFSHSSLLSSLTLSSPFSPFSLHPSPFSGFGCSSPQTL
jgi:hypothetical protein